MPKNVTFDREKILQSLVPVFVKNGYNGTSMQDIVDTTGLNRSSIYNSFGDKQALYTAVLAYYSGRQIQIKTDILKIDDNVKTALRKFFEKLFLREADPDNTDGCLLTNCSLEMGQSDAGIRNILLNSKEIMIKNFSEILELGLQKEDIKADIDPRQYASFLYNNLQGLRVLNGGNRDSATTKLIIRQLFESI
ncbi:MAG: TetR/AcrR family transcriptional regulator [Cyclobacteriaceae bacterium]